MTEHPKDRVSSIESHPKILELQDQGIKSKRLLDNILLVYLQLIEVYQWFDVDTVIVPSKQLVFVKGRKSSKGEIELLDYVLPVSHDATFTTSSLNEYMECAKSCGWTGESLTLAFVDTSSTVSFYNVTPGLVPPAVPSRKEMEKMQNATPYWNERKRKWKASK